MSSMVALMGGGDGPLGGEPRAAAGSGCLGVLGGGCLGGGGGEAQEGEGFLHDALHGPEAADAFVAAGEEALVGADEMGSALGEDADVLLGGGVEPHFAVHGRGDEERCGGGQGDGGEGVVGEAVGEFGEDIGGGGRDEEEAGLISEGDVAGVP